MTKFELEKAMLKEELSSKKAGRGRLLGKHKSEAEKLHIVKAYLAGQYSLEECARVFHVGESSITRWIAKFAEEKSEMRIPEAPAASSASSRTDGLNYNQSANTYMAKQNNPDQANTPETLKAEIDRLKRELEIANYKIHVRDVIIEEAEKTFNIPIRKKSGAKQ